MESLVFLVIIRPNISFGVSLVSRYMNEQLEIHSKAAKIIFRYVKGTIDFGIHYYSSFQLRIGTLLVIVILIGELVWMIKNLLLKIVLPSIQD